MAAGDPRPADRLLIAETHFVEVVVLAFALRCREDRFSCHLCRTRKQVETSSFLAT
jgi:hypothetical protein